MMLRHTFAVVSVFIVLVSASPALAAPRAVGFKGTLKAGKVHRGKLTRADVRTFDSFGTKLRMPFHAYRVRLIKGKLYTFDVRIKGLQKNKLGVVLQVYLHRIDPQGKTMAKLHAADEPKVVDGGGSTGQYSRSVIRPLRSGTYAVVVAGGLIKNNKVTRKKFGAYELRTYKRRLKQLGLHPKTHAPPHAP